MSNNKRITVCLGSSCFARGNENNLETIEKFIEEHKIDAEIEISGSRCENLCAKGPVVTVNEEVYYSVTPEKLLEILEELKR